MENGVRERGLAGLLDHIDEEARQEGPTGTSQVDALDRYCSLFGQVVGSQTIFGGVRAISARAAASCSATYGWLSAL